MNWAHFCVSARGFVGARLVIGGILLVAIWSGTVPRAAAQRFLPDDPLWSDPDRMDTSFPEPRPLGDGVGPFEFLNRTFRVPGHYSEPALNVNTLGGVPNSSWYTNRHYRFPMSPAELKRGPNREPAPVKEGKWRVVRFLRGKELPRALIEDPTGRRFRILLDSASHPELATGAAMIGSRLLYALGYYVPQYWLVRVQPDRFVPRKGSAVTRAEIDSLFELSPKGPNGSYRVLATRIPGVSKRLGPFRFRGTRPDDANDVFPHQNRRELRGLRIFSSWIHHTNIQPRHTLDVGVREEGRRFVRHYLTDLHLTLGSGGATPKPPWAGHEYVLELDRIFERITTLGLSGGQWAETQVPDWPALGRYSPDRFDPTKWRPKWPNPAFQRCDAADAFWAAKQVHHFSKADLEAIVATAEYTSPQVANYVLQTLLLRRHAIADAYLDWGGGLARFSVRRGRLTFQDIPGPSRQPDTLQREITWHVYHNLRDSIGRELTRVRTSREVLPLPPTSHRFLRGTIRTPRKGITYVYLREERSIITSPSGAPLSYEVVGVERRSQLNGRL